MAKKDAPKKKQVMESKYNPVLLRQLCEDGVDAKTAKEQLGLSSLQSLRSHLMRLSVEDNQLRTLVGLYERSNSRVRITKHGIKITPKKLEAIEADFALNSEFTVEVDENKIILSLVTATGPDGEDEASDLSEDGS